MDARGAVGGEPGGDGHAPRHPQRAMGPAARRSARAANQATGYLAGAGGRADFRSRVSFALQSGGGTCVGNRIAQENCLAGAPRSEWDLAFTDVAASAGDPSIQGFTTEFSVNRTATSGPAQVRFKVNTTAAKYRLQIYRMGYYGGMGARRIATVTQPTGPGTVTSDLTGTNQPACLTEDTGLIDCGNWSVSATWDIPANAVSGIYFAKAIRQDNGGASHIFFVIRDDAGRLRSALPDVRHDLAGLQRLRRQQPVHRQPGGTRVQGELQPAVHHARGERGRASELGLQRRIPDGALAGSQRLRRELHLRHRYRSARQRNCWSTRSSSPSATTSTGRAAARQCRGGARRRPAPGVLQRQRGVLEDAVGAEHRRVGDAVPHARLLQGDARDEKIDPEREQSGPAPGATRARSTPRARSRRTRSPARSSRSTASATTPSWCRRSSARTGSGATRASPRCSRGRRPSFRRGRSATSGTRISTTVSAPPACSGCRPRRSTSRRVPAGSRLQLRRGHGDAQPDAVPRAERRARVRRRHGAVVVGPRHQSRQSEQRAAELRDAAGDGQPLRRHGRPALVAAEWYPDRDRHERPTPPRHRPSCRRPPNSSVQSGDSLVISGTATDTTRRPGQRRGVRRRRRTRGWPPRASKHGSSPGRRPATSRSR